MTVVSVSFWWVNRHVCRQHAECALGMGYVLQLRLFASYRQFTLSDLGSALGILVGGAYLL